MNGVVKAAVAAARVIHLLKKSLSQKKLDRITDDPRCIELLNCSRNDVHSSVLRGGIQRRLTAAIEAEVKSFLSQPTGLANQSGIRTRSNQFIVNEFYKLDGNASRRAAELILRCSANSSTNLPPTTANTNH